VVGLCVSVDVEVGVGVGLSIVVLGDRVVVGKSVVKEGSDEDTVVEFKVIIVENSDGSTQLYWQPLLTRQLCRRRL